MICPNCGSVGCCYPFYEVRDVPTNSCLLVEDRARALDFPTGDIALSVCRGCSFIFNAAWDPHCTIYSDQYEETQGFSPTFNAFNRAIAEELISSYDIRFVRKFFPGNTKEIAPDLLCCKMTLEHIGQTHRFLSSVRSVANRKDSVIFF